MLSEVNISDSEAEETLKPVKKGSNSPKKLLSVHHRQSSTSVLNCHLLNVHREPLIASAASNHLPSVPPAKDKAAAEVLNDSTLALHPSNSMKSPAYAPNDLRDSKTDKPIFLQPFDVAMFEPAHTLTCIFCNLFIVSDLNILFLVFWKPLQL
jgi:hypothetical protein